MLHQFTSKYAYVTLAFAVLGLLYPAMVAGAGGRVVWQASFSVLLVVVVWASCRRPHQRTAGTVLATLAIASGVATTVLGLGAGWWGLVSEALTVVFLGFTTLVLLADVLHGRTVSLDKMFGAACVYFMIGLTFAVLYQFINGASTTDAFAFPLAEAAAAAGEPASRVAALRGVSQPGDDLPLFLYHSFVSLTTLGYGDVVPVSPWARLLSSTEAIIGQLYLTILVARLVGLHISQRGVTSS